MRKLLVAMFMWAALCSSSYAGQSFMPENSLDQEDYLWADGDVGISQEAFNKVAKKIYNIYKPIVANLGGNLKMSLRWSDSTVNAYADRQDGNWNITFFGGLARRKEITEGGFALIVCHELAHHIGGYPLYTGDDWAAVEGQSDAAGMQACLRKYYAGVQEDVKTLSTYAVEKCKAAYSGQELRECYWRMSAGKSCADLLGALNGEKPRFETPSKVVVSKIMEEHPPSQCRLDQYAASALTKKVWDDGVIPSHSSHTKYNGERVRCWWAP